MFRDRLVVDIGQETIQKTGACIVRVPRLVRLGMMNVVRDDIRFFRNDIDRHISRHKSPEPATESIGMVRAIPVIPDSAMRTHDDHAVNKSNPQQGKREIMKQKDKKTGSAAAPLSN